MNQALRIVSVIGLTSVLTLGACSPKMEVRGNMLSDQQVQRIEPYITNKAQVQQMLGTPSAKAMFNDDIWYYVGQTTEQTAFLNAEVTDREIYAITFTEEGFVASIDPVDAAGEEVPIVDRETPTSGHNLTLMQQLLGNIGKFNTAESNTVTPGI